MKIKEAEKRNLREILELQYLAYQSEARLFDNNDIPPLKQTLQEVELEFDRGLFLKLVDENGKIIGSVRAFAEGGTLFIGKLMVHPDHQGLGLGAKLLKAVEEARPHNRYELFTSSKSKKNIQLYQRAGYKMFKEHDVSGDLKFVYLEKYRHEKSGD